MRTARVVLGVVLGAMVAAAVAGCGSAARSGGETATAFSIDQVGQLLHAYQKGKKPPPKGLKDVAPLVRIYPAAVSSLQTKDVLLHWGVGLSDGPDAASTVLAYQKDVPEKGGEVLMQDGTAKKMTADEFKAARKPEGATTDGGPAAKKK